MIITLDTEKETASMRGEIPFDDLIEFMRHHKLKRYSIAIKETSGRNGWQDYNPPYDSTSSNPRLAIDVGTDNWNLNNNY